MDQIIICYSSHDQGIELVDHLSKRQSVYPVYWIGGLPDFGNKVLKRFPETTYQTQAESNVSGPPSMLLADKGNLGDMLDDNEFETMSLSILDRFLSIIDVESHQDKLSHFYFLKDRYARLLKKINPRFCYFGEIPHSLGTFILYSLCLRLKIKTVINAYTCFQDRFRYLNFYQEIGEMKSIPATPKPSEEAAGKVDDLIKRLQSNYQSAKPHYMKKKGHRNPFYILPRLGIYFYKWKTKFNFYKMTVNALPAEPFIYVALHYQPELSTMPMGDHFGNQWLMIRLISDNLPQGWKILVKEHPSQGYITKGNQRFFRSSYFYRSISEIENVCFISTDFESFKLLDNAQVIATVTGTIALEAVLRGKCCLMFGSAPINQLDGILNVRDNRSCADAFDRVNRGVKPDIEKIRTLLCRLYDDSLPYRTANDIEGFVVDQHVEAIEKRLL